MSQAYSEFRSARESAGEDRLIRMWESLNLIEHPDLKSIALKEFWACDVHKLASLVKWGPNQEEESLWFIDENEWTLSLGSIPLATEATLDLQPLQKKWALISAWSVLPIWEEWAKENAPKHLHSIRTCLEVSSDPNSSEEEMDSAWSASKAAKDAATYTSEEELGGAWSAAQAACDAARDAAWAAWAANDGGKAAARDAAWFSAMSVGREGASPSRDTNYTEWCYKWTVHVLEHIRNSNGYISDRVSG